MREDAEKMDENKKKDTLKRMGEMADLNAIRQIKECLLKNEKGDIKGTVQNYMMIFRDDPLIKGCLRYNRLSERVDISRKLWWDEDWEILTDNAIDQFYLYFEVYYGLGNEKNLYKALQIEAANRAYHPICEYLETLKWDGEERIRYVLKKYMGSDDSDYVYEVLKHFMMEALLRVFYPGIKADEMLCLVGQQGAGKSTFFRFLSLKDNWFSDDLRDLGDKKVFESIRGHWIIEMSEMIAAISAKSNEEIKSFLSRQKDTYRTAYARFEKDRKRQCVFAGSTNTYQFIPFDRTGARRFLPIMSKRKLMSTGNSLCKRILWQEQSRGGLIIIKEIMYVLFRFGVRLLITGIVSLRSMRRMKFVKSWIHRLLDGSEAVIIDLPQKGMEDNAVGLEKVKR